VIKEKMEEKLRQMIENKQRETLPLARDHPFTTLAQGTRALKIGYPFQLLNSNTTQKRAFSPSHSLSSAESARMSLPPQVTSHNSMTSSPRLKGFMKFIFRPPTEICFFKIG
jgi:hypothetical protein